LDGQATARRWSASAAQPTPDTGAWVSPCGLATAASSSGARSRPSMLSRRLRARSMEILASSPACLRLSSARRSSVRALLTDGECTEPDVPPWRRRCLDTDPPAEPGEAYARLRRRSTSSRHCLCASGDAASPGGLRSNSLAAMRGSLGGRTDWATEARSAAHGGAGRGATLEAGWREACGAVDATSSPIRRSWWPFSCAIEVVKVDRAQSKSKPPTWRAKCRRNSPAGWRKAPA
jgi:hypothetical protein